MIQIVFRTVGVGQIIVGLFHARFRNSRERPREVPGVFLVSWIDRSDQTANSGELGAPHYRTLSRKLALHIHIPMPWPTNCQVQCGLMDQVILLVAWFAHQVDVVGMNWRNCKRWSTCVLFVTILRIKYLLFVNGFSIMHGPINRKSVNGNLLFWWSVSF